MTAAAIQAFFRRHLPSATGLAGLGAALDARANGATLGPGLAAAVNGMLATLDGADLLEGVSAGEATVLLAMLRATLGVDTKLLSASGRAQVWNHTEPEVLDAFGTVARVTHAATMTDVVIPVLAGLGDRLAAEGAAFLDVGVGVGGLAIEMARRFPRLRVVGIDVFAPPLVRARASVAAAGLADRIELRERAAEDLTDDRAFDLAWLPPPFLAATAIAPACVRIREALRPGGFVVATPLPVGDASWRLRAELWAGHATGAAEMEEKLRAAGFVDVRTLAAPPGSPVVPVIGRRAE